MKKAPESVEAAEPATLVAEHLRRLPPARRGAASSAFAQVRQHDEDTDQQRGEPDHRQQRAVE